MRVILTFCGFSLICVSVIAETHVYIERNEGQAPASSPYMAHVGDRIVGLTGDGVQFLATGRPIAMHFHGALAPSSSRPIELLPGVSNYYVGAHRKARLEGIRHYGGVEFSNVYRGVDVIFRSNGDNLEFDYRLAAGIDTETIKLDFEGISRLGIDADGDLVIDADDASVRYRRPRATQERGSVVTELSARYAACGQNSVGIEVDGIDRSLPLTIDPELIYSTYLGGSGSESLSPLIAAHRSGSAYIAGMTNSLDFPPPGSSSPGLTAFVSRFAPDGSLLYTTFFGSGVTDRVTAVAVDGSGNAYVAGSTAAVSFPRTIDNFGGFTPGIAFPGLDTAVFITKFGPLGALVYSNFISQNGAATAAAADEQGHVFYAVENLGLCCTTPGGMLGHNTTISVVKVSLFGDAPDYIVALGSLSAADSIRAIAIDQDGNAFVAGTTGHGFVTTPGCYREQFLHDRFDGFVSKINATGTALLYSTYIGAEVDDPFNFRQFISGIAVDHDGNAYVAGGTSSSLLPIVPANGPVAQPIKRSPQPFFGGFVSKLSADGSRLIYSTYLGGSGNDGGIAAIGIDPGDHAIVTGTTSSSDFPTTTSAHQRPLGPDDCFLTRLSVDGSRFDYSALIGGSGDDSCAALGVAGFRAFVAGLTDSIDLRLKNPAQPRLAPPVDFFVAAFDFEPAPVIFVPGVPGSVLNEGPVERFPNPLDDWTRLSLDPSGPMALLRPTDIHRPTYAALLDYLHSRGFREYQLEGNSSRLTLSGCDMSQAPQRPNLFVFPYDWRYGFDDAANGPVTKLVDYIACVQRLHPGSKINIVAHSTGGLVTRRLLLERPSQVQNVKQIITIGSPWLGAVKAIGTLYQGWFSDIRILDAYIPIPIVTSRIRRLAPFFPSLHQLVPSRSYHTIVSGIPGFKVPLRDEHWSGSALLTTHDYTYDELVARLNRDFPGGPAGSNNARFHDFAGQDDWSADTTGIRFTHFVGVQSNNHTIVQVRDAHRRLCNPDPPNSCVEQRFFWPVHDRGDGTVPFFSGWRTQAMLAPNTDRVLIDHPEEQAGHTELPANPIVQARTLDLLTSSENGATSVASLRVHEGALSDVDKPLTIQRPSVYVTLLGINDLTVSDTAGHTTAVDPRTGLAGKVSGVSVDVLGDGAWSVLLDATRDYQIAFTATGGPLMIDLARGLTDAQPDVTVRYLDVVIPAGAPSIIKVPSSGLWEVRYDADGSGTFQSIVPPTASATGASALDTTPPTVAFSRTAGSVTITATDDASGVRQIRYSLDGIHFLPYSSPVNAVGSTTVYAFADDNVGNRSATLQYVVPATQVPTSIVYAGPSNGTVGRTVSLAGRLTDRSGSAMVGSPVSFQIHSQSASATTGSEGVATATLMLQGPGGATSVVARYSGDANHLPAEVAQTFTVLPRPTTLALSATPTTFAVGSSRRVTAVLRDTNQTPLPGQAVIFNLAETRVSATTDSSGTAAATIPMPASAATGPATLEARFDGDASSTAARTSMTLMLYQAHPFVVWGGTTPTLRIGDRVNFWGSLWSRQMAIPEQGEGNHDQLDDFKGYATLPAGGSLSICEPRSTPRTNPPLDARCWTAREGNGRPPAVLPSHIGLIVATSIAKTGQGEDLIYGNIAATVVIRVDTIPAYGPTPGRPGYGTIVAVIEDAASVIRTQ